MQTLVFNFHLEPLWDIITDAPQSKCVSGPLARDLHWQLGVLRRKWVPQDCCRYINSMLKSTVSVLDFSQIRVPMGGTGSELTLDLSSNPPQAWGYMNLRKSQSLQSILSVSERLKDEFTKLLTKSSTLIWLFLMKEREVKP